MVDFVHVFQGLFIGSVTRTTIIWLLSKQNKTHERMSLAKLYV